MGKRKKEEDETHGVMEWKLAASAGNLSLTVLAEICSSDTNFDSMLNARHYTFLGPHCDPNNKIQFHHLLIKFPAIHSFTKEYETPVERIKQREIKIPLVQLLVHLFYYEKMFFGR